MDVVVHRARFVEAQPSGVVATSLHPDGTYLAVARANCNLELWMTDGQSSSPLTAVASGLDPASGAGWSVAAVIPGTAALPLQCLVWSPVKSRTIPGVDGCRLFAASLNGAIYEADWLSRRLRHAADSNGGSVWSLAATSLVRLSGAAGAGALLAAGCEDGSVRLLRADPTSSPLEHVASCPGTEGRVMSCAWHPQAPVLFAGTATGAVRGWDLTAVTQSLLSVYEGQQASRSAVAAARARARASAHAGKGVKAGKGPVQVDHDSDVSSDEDMAVQGGGPTSAYGGAQGRGALTGPRPMVHFRVEPHALGKASKGVAAASVVWSLAVASNMTVVTADSSGAVQAWDGRTGVLASSVPLARHTGDALTLCLAEEGGGQGREGEGAVQKMVRRIVVASGGVDGRVIVVATVPSINAVTVSSAWAQVGAHASHAAPVRSVALWLKTPGARGGPFVASAGADGCVCTTRTSDLSSPTGGAGPRRYGPVADTTGQVCTAGGAGRVVAHTGAAVQVWDLRRGVQGQGVPDAPSLMVQIDTPSAHALGRADMPVAQPAGCAVSEDGCWMAYASAGDALPRVVYIQTSPSNATHSSARTSIPTPLSVRLVNEAACRLTLEAAAGKVAGARNAAVGAAVPNVLPGPPSQMVFVRAGLRDCHLLLFTSCARLFVHVCTGGSSGDEPASKRARDADSASPPFSADPSAAFAYSLPVPSAASDPIRAASTSAALALLQGAGGGAGELLGMRTLMAGSAGEAPLEGKRKRSATADSAALGSGAPSDGDYAGSAESGEGEGEGGGTSYTLSGRAGQGSGSVCLPLLLTATRSLENTQRSDTAYACVATSTRHAHVFLLGCARGELALTLPRLPAQAAAACFLPGATALVLLLRDASVLAYDTSGRLLPWSPARPGSAPGPNTVGSSTAPPALPRAWQSRLRADQARCLLPLCGASMESIEAGGEGHLQVGTAIKFMCTGADTLATLSINAAPGTGAGSDSTGSGSAVKGSSTTKSAQTSKAAPRVPVTPAYSCVASVGVGYDNVLLVGLATQVDSLPSSVSASAGAAGAQIGALKDGIGNSGVKQAKGKRGSTTAEAPLLTPSVLPCVHVAVVDVPWRAVSARLGLLSKPTQADAEDNAEAAVSSSAGTLARLGQGLRRAAKYGRG